MAQITLVLLAASGGGLAGCGADLSFLRDGGVREDATVGSDAAGLDGTTPDAGTPSCEGADWSHVDHGPARTGYNPCETWLVPSEVPSLEVQWSNQVGCTINTGVSVVDQVVYYGDYCGGFFAVDARTGAQRWSAAIERSHTGQAVVDGVAYVSARCTYEHCGSVYAFNAATGALQWRWTHPSSHVGIPVVAYGSLYVHASAEHVLYSIVGSSGAVEYVVPASRDAAAGNGRVFVPDGHRIRYIDPAGGLELGVAVGHTWDGSDFSRPAVANGMVYASKPSGWVYAFPDTEYGLPGGDDWVWSVDLQVNGPGVQPPAVTPSTVFVGAGSRLHALDAATGAERWRRDTHCVRFQASPSVAGGVVYAVCDGSSLYAWDASTGQELWAYHTYTEYDMRASPAVSRGWLYHAATFDFHLYGLTVVP